MQHPPVVTLGRSTKPGNLLVTPEYLASRGIALHDVERGGDVTWHGPGQLVGYPIVDLRLLRLGSRAYVQKLAQALAFVLAELGIASHWQDDAPGLWTDHGKIAAIGVHIHRGVTTHGFAINVEGELAGFRSIVPCGLAGRRVTSISAQTGASVADPSRGPAWLRDSVAARLGEVLAVDIARPMSLDLLRELPSHE